MIKEFPDSPRLRTIAEYQENNNNYFINSNGFGTLCHRYSKRSIEENPEFWKEVKEEFVTAYGVNESFTKIAYCLESKIKQDFAAGNWQWFDTEEERDKYIEKYKPRFSKEDMLEFETYCRMYQPRQLAFEKFMESKK